MIEKIAKIINEHKECVFVFKGFTPNLLKKYEIDLPNSYSEFIEGDKLNLNNLLNEDLEIPHSNTFLFFEQFLCISDKLLKNRWNSKKFLLINNNLIDYYPAFYNIESEDIESYFFNEVIKISNTIYCKPRSFNLLDIYDNEIYTNIKKVDIFQDEQVLIVPEIFDENNHIDIYFSDDENQISGIYNLLLSEKTNFTILVEFYHINSHKLKLIRSHYGNDVIFYTTPAINLNRINFDEKKGEELKRLLLDKWGFESFKDLKFYKNIDDDNLYSETENLNQLKIIQFVIEQAEIASKNKDVNSYKDCLLTSPTGAGKSLLFQLTALYLGLKYQFLTIVISPLKALMDDQVLGIPPSISSHFSTIHGDISENERNIISQNITKNLVHCLYISPEMFSYLKINDFSNRKIGLLVVDEAHTVAYWGSSFRPDYLFIRENLNKLEKDQGNKIPIFALTATATHNQNQDFSSVHQILHRLKMNRPMILNGYVKRDNIKFNVVNHVLGNNRLIQFKIQRLLEFLNRRYRETPTEKTLTYIPFKHRSSKMRINQSSIIDSFIDDNGLSNKDQIISYFDSGVDMNQRKIRLENYRNDNHTLKSLLATNAFGMGVDIPDIMQVYHLALKGTLADYVQEIGRSVRNQNLIGFANLDYVSEGELYFSNLLFRLNSVSNQALRRITAVLIDMTRNEHGNPDLRRRKLILNPELFRGILGVEENERGLTDFINPLKKVLHLVKEEALFHSPNTIFKINPKPINTNLYVRVPTDNNILDGIPEYFEHVGEFPFGSNNINCRVYQFNAESFYSNCQIDELREMTFSQFTSIFAQKTDSRARRLLDNNQLTFLNNIESVVFYRFNLTNKQLLEKVISILQSMENLFIQHRTDKIININPVESGINNMISELNVDITFEEILSLYIHFGKPSFIVDIDKNLLKIQQNNGFYYNTSSKISEFQIALNNQDGVYYSWFAVYSLNKNVIKKKTYDQMIHLFSILNCGDVDFRSGENPSISIIINPNDLRRMAQPGYSFNVLSTIWHQREYENAALTGLFESNHDMNTEDRWDYIEKYFLGKLEVEA